MSGIGINRRGLLAGASALGTTVALSACGAKTGSGTSSAAGAQADTSGDTVKVGLLNSLSGTMAISEVTVHNALLLAVKEINAAGGVLGKKLKPISQDGASDWPTFAEKAEALITDDKVVATFGCWTSASRKAVKPVFERYKSLLFYPVQYEGLEQSPYIFYIGATTNQQIVPALDYLKKQGLTRLYLVGSDYVFPRTANKIIKAYAQAQGMKVVGEDYAPLGSTEFSTIVNKVKDSRRGRRVQHPQRRQQRGLLQGVQVRRAGREEPAGAVGVDRRGGGQEHRYPVPGRPVDRLELLRDHAGRRQHEVRRGLSGGLRQGQADQRPHGGRLHLRPSLEGDGREGQAPSTCRRSRRPPGASNSTPPRARSPSTEPPSTSTRPPASAGSARTA